jgi:hypothetical protein
MFSSSSFGTFSGAANTAPVFFPAGCAGMLKKAVGAPMLRLAA